MGYMLEMLVENIVKQHSLEEQEEGAHLVVLAISHVGHSF